MKELSADVVTRLRQNWKTWSLPARGLPGAAVRHAWLALLGDVKGKWNTWARTICSSWTQMCQVGKCPQGRLVCWAWVLPQLDYPGWAELGQFCPWWSSREVKNAELLLAVLYQRELWPIVSLAPDPAQNVSLLHGLPVILSSSPQDQMPASLLNWGMTELCLHSVLLSMWNRGDRDPQTPFCAPCICFFTFLSLISLSR